MFIVKKYYVEMDVKSGLPAEQSDRRGSDLTRIESDRIGCSIL